MRVLLALVLLAPLTLAQDNATPWGVVWGEVLRLRVLDPASPEARDLFEELEEIAAREASDPRARLLLAQLDLVAGRDPRPRAPRVQDVEAELFTGTAAWLLAEVQVEGAQRVEAILRALAASESLEQKELMLAWNTAVDEARALRLEQGALPIQEVLHARYQASWSAMDLALTRSTLGDVAGADALLAGVIEAEAAAGRPTTELWTRRGIAALGIGDEPRARDYLGRALAQGSGDAALVLARLDLDAGRLRAARLGFRPSILVDPPAAWALRGWGVSLLPAALEAPRP